jgi:hypothetical protein
MYDRIWILRLKYSWVKNELVVKKLIKKMNCFFYEQITRLSIGKNTWPS